MAEIGDVQQEAAFQKQSAIFVGAKRALGAKSKKAARFTRNIGLGYKTPKEAVEGTYIDKKCPFTSGTSIRGRILKGIVLSTRMKRTIVVRRDFLHYIRKFRRYEKRHKNTPAHASPAFRIKEGDVVQIAQCRPLSKTVRYNVVTVEPARFAKTPGQIKKSFRMF
jgi:small subunit ribosomal protein S11e